MCTYTTYIFPSICALPDLEVLKRYDPKGLLIRWTLEVVEAVICQDKPPLPPALVFASLLGQVALVIRVEEYLRELISSLVVLERGVADSVIVTLRNTHTNTWNKACIAVCTYHLSITNV